MPTIYRYETPLVVDQARYNQLINRAGYFATPTKAQSKIGESGYGDPRLGKRLYNDLSPFNIPLPLGIPQHANTANFITRLQASITAQGCNVALGQYSPTAYFVDNGTPRKDVTLEGYDGTTRIMRNVPIPSHAVVDPSDDAHMCILDMTRGIEYDFFGMAKTNGVWGATWGCVYPTTSSGFQPYGLSARATGAALMAGVIWPHELKAGVINHALAFAYPYTALAGPVGPATGSDGTSVLTDAMPEGSRLQLNPGVDINSLNLNPIEKIIATAMQKYGMILVDTGGATAMYAVNPLSFSNNPYAGIWDSSSPAITLANMPINHLRVLDSGPVLPKQYKIVATQLVQIDEV